jgi:hypothetical protein
MVLNIIGAEARIFWILQVLTRENIYRRAQLLNARPPIPDWMRRML